MTHILSQPVLLATAARAVWVSEDGEIKTYSLPDKAQATEAQRFIGTQIRQGVCPLVCHGTATARRFGQSGIIAYDVLELYAFVYPATFCLPTPNGVAAALNLPMVTTLEDEALHLYTLAETLLKRLYDAIERMPSSEGEKIIQLVRSGFASGWPWGGVLLQALNAPSAPPPDAKPLHVWNDLPEWEETSDFAPSVDHDDSVGIYPQEAERRLVEVLGNHAEKRDDQRRYTRSVADAFRPRRTQDVPEAVIIEAGTGIGKTIGYLVPAGLWAERNNASVWISTYTRNLQRQIYQEIDRLYPAHADKDFHVVVRKGRENYLCLLNYQDATVRTMTMGGVHPQSTGAPVLLARWIEHTNDGDMEGGDFPGWLVDILGRENTLALNDRRGECIHGACLHYRRCFIEHNRRKSARAHIVVANHALVMMNAARYGTTSEAQNTPDRPPRPSHPMRIVFDEGHHLFDAADSAFARVLGGRSLYDLRRWLVGAEGGLASRARGLKGRVGDIIGLLDDGMDTLEEVLRAARAALSPWGWMARLEADNPQGPADTFLSHVRTHVLACNRHKTQENWTIEAPSNSSDEALLAASNRLETALARLSRALTDLLLLVQDNQDEKADGLEKHDRQRLHVLSDSLQTQALEPVLGWRSMLASLDCPARQDAEGEFVDWFSLERKDGRDEDVNFHRHHLNPSDALARHIMTPAHGVLVTSATLCTGNGSKDDDPHARDAQMWQDTRIMTGLESLSRPPRQHIFSSPFDYAQQTKIFVVNDIDYRNIENLARAFQTLFLASGGGALGLFTAINRLRNVHGRIIRRLEEEGLPLFAQHVDPIDTPTLVDMFRAEEESCLLGTDAMRDGIDVPGRSLRLIVFERVPWPRPTILHTARKRHFSSIRWADRQTRLALKQAFGRLVRRHDDRGVFVLLDPAMPSRFRDAFPAGVEIVRTGLKETTAEISLFLGTQ